MSSADLTIITGFSSLKHVDSEWLRKLLNMIEEVIGPCEFCEGSMIDDIGRESVGQLVDRLSESVIAERLRSGGFSFISSKFPAITGFVSNDRFAAPAVKVPQSELCVVLPLAVISKLEFGSSVRDLCGALARHGECNLLFCADREHFDVRFDTELHLGIGLLDVYWINVFGPAYARVVGIDKIAGAPSYFTERIGGEYGLIQITETFRESIGPIGREVRRSVKDFIGERFFAKARDVSPKVRGVQLSIWQLTKVIGLFRRQNSAFKDISRKADIVPEVLTPGQFPSER